MNRSDPRKAIEDIFGSLKGVFQRHDRSARKKAWDATISTKGRLEVDKFINSPSRQIVGIQKLLSFKEWFESNPF